MWMCEGVCICKYGKYVVCVCMCVFVCVREYMHVCVCSHACVMMASPECKCSADLTGSNRSTKLNYALLCLCVFCTFQISL